MSSSSGNTGRQRVPAFDVRGQIGAFQAAFRAEGTTERAVGQKAYLKSKLEFHGVTIPIIRRTAKAFRREHRHLGRDDLLALIEGLWATPHHDLRSLAIALLELYVDVLQAGDMDIAEELLRHCHTWDHVDWLSTKVAGSLVERHTEAKRVLPSWSGDEHFWLRRASMLALLGPLRSGQGDFGLFARFASGMVEEEEFFIRKAIGWVLREVAKKRPELTYAFLAEHLDRVSGLTLREGAKYLPAEQQAELKKRYQARSGKRR